MSRAAVKKAGKAIFFFLGLFILFLVLLEIGLRHVGYFYSPLHIEKLNSADWRMWHAFEDRHFVYDPYLIWAPKKGHSVFNSQGFRGKVLEYGKKPGEIRIFTVGDSNTLGGDGKNAPAWPMYLEQLLVKDDPGVVVVNAGAWGYSSFQGYRMFQLVKPFEPDIVVVSFGGNDALLTGISDAEFLKKRFFNRINLDKSLIKYKAGQLLIQICDVGKAGKGRQPVPRVSIAEYKENISKIIAEARKLDIQVVLLTRPFLGTSADLFWQNHASRYSQATIEVAFANNVPVVDLAAPFLYKAEFFVDQGHFNEEGHRKAAGLIYETVRPLITGGARP